MKKLILVILVVLSSNTMAQKIKVMCNIDKIHKMYSTKLDGGLYKLDNGKLLKFYYYKEKNYIILYLYDSEDIVYANIIIPLQIEGYEKTYTLLNKLYDRESENIWKKDYGDYKVIAFFDFINDEKYGSFLILTPLAVRYFFEKNEE